jgi:hypothetical protein
MSGIVLRIHDDTDLERVAALLALFIKRAEVKATLSGSTVSSG